MPTSRARPGWRFACWCGLVVLLGSTLLFQAWRGIRLETNILALLPATEQDEVVEEAVTAFTRKMSGNLFFLLGHADSDKAREGGRDLWSQLQASGHFHTLIGPVDEEAERHYFDFFFPYRYQLLSPEHRRQLADLGPDPLLREAEQALYSPMTSVYSRILEEDPLFLFPAFLRGLPEPPGNLQLREGWLTAEKDGISYLFLTATSADDAFARSGQRWIETFLQSLQQQFPREQGFYLYATGVPRYAAHGAATAEGEISTIGSLSLLGVVVLFLGVFRSIRPLFLGLLPIFTGLLCATTVSFLVFPKVHLLTLGFGAGLIGVCIDYTFHYFCERYENPRETGGLVLGRIFSAISIGAFSSSLGYLGLVIAPFPGLRQMAVFSIAGLAGAYLTVVLCFPFLVRPTRRQASSAKRLAEAYLALWRRLRARPGLLLVLAGLLAVVVAGGLLRLRPGDDIRELQEPPEHLLREETMIRQLAGGVDASRFLLIEGDSQQEVLLREEQVSLQLAGLRQQGVLEFFHGVTTMMPSEAKQRENRHLLQTQLAGETQALALYLDKMGFSEATRDANLAQLNTSLEPISLNAWLEHPVSAPLRPFWLGATSRGFASMLVLGGIGDASQLEALAEAQPGVHYIDKVADTSALMGRYRQLATQLVAVSYGVVLLLLIGRYGWRQGSRVTLVPVSAALFALACLGYLGWPLNLFHILALMLVMGIGIDYTVFFAESSRARSATMLAIMLSGTTTVLSFGLLALSSTPVLRSFGLVVLAAIALALALSPLAGRTTPDRREAST